MTNDFSISILNNMTIEIRALTIDDYDSMVKVWNLAGLPHKPRGRDSRKLIAREMSSPQCGFFGAFDGDRMVGVIIANYDGRRGSINRLAIEPDYRHKGIASSLIAESEKFLKGLGALVIYALIEEINYPSISAFQKNGYVCNHDIRFFSKRNSDED